MNDVRHDDTVYLDPAASVTGLPPMYASYPAWEDALPASIYDGGITAPAAQWPSGSGWPPLGRGQHRFFWLLGLGWGIMTAFGGVIIEKFSGGALWAGWVMAAGLGLALLFTCIHSGGAGPLLAPLANLTGILFCCHALAAMLSAVVANSNPIFAARFIMLTGAIGVVLYARNFHPGALASLRVGLTAAGLIVCLYNMQYVPSGAITNTAYRLNTFLNASANGIIAAITVVSLLEYAMSYLGRRKPKAALFLLGCTAVAALTVFLTRSRTATAAALAGVVVLLSLRTRPLAAIAAILGCVAVYLVFDQAVRGAGQSFVDLYQLGEHGRDLNTMSGRTTLWKQLIFSVWLENPILGAGPGFLATSMGTASHNAFLYYLSEVGLAGTLPLVALVVICLISAVAHRKDASLHWAIAIFAAAMTESFAESELFSFGNPGSLLFLAAVVALVAAQVRPRAGARLRGWDQGPQDARGYGAEGPGGAGGHSGDRADPYQADWPSADYYGN